LLTIDASPSPLSGLIVRWKQLLLPINLSMESELVQRHDVLPTLMLDGVQNNQKFLCSLESGQFFNVSKSVRDSPKMLHPPPHAVRQIRVDTELRYHHPLRDLTERKRRSLRKHRRDPIVKSEILFKLPDDKGIFVFRPRDEFSNIFSNSSFRFMPTMTQRSR
jgi:hypothetical protein